MATQKQIAWQKCSRGRVERRQKHSSLRLLVSYRTLAKKSHTYLLETTVASPHRYARRRAGPHHAGQEAPGPRTTAAAVQR